MIDDLASHFVYQNIWCSCYFLKQIDRRLLHSQSTAESVDPPFRKFHGICVTHSPLGKNTKNQFLNKINKNSHGRTAPFSFVVFTKFVFLNFSGHCCCRWNWERTSWRIYSKFTGWFSLILAPPSGNEFKFDDFKRSFWQSRSSRNRIISAAESWATAGVSADSGDIISVMLSSCS